MNSFQGKVAIVTGGGGSGIGHHLVIALAQAGARVAFCDIAQLATTAAKLDAVSADYFSQIVDMGDKSAINAFIDSVVAHYGQIDVLINNAGIALGDLTFAEVSEHDFEKITTINYWGVIHTTQCCYAHLLARPEAAIVNVSSAQGILAVPYLVPYCTTKFAVRGFTDSLRAEHKIRGIKHVSVHTVHPGAVATNITLNADHHNSSTAKFHEFLQQGTSPAKAAEIILRGIKNNTGRIFISDGRLQDLVARLLPSSYVVLVRLMMRLRKMTIR